MKKPITALSLVLCVLATVSWKVSGNTPAFSAAAVENVLNQITEEAVAIYEVSRGKKPATSLPVETQKNIYSRSASETALKLREFGAVIAKDPAGRIRFHTIIEGSEFSVSTYEALPSELERIGGFHTHPWKYEQVKNLPFSPGDIANLYRPRLSVPIRENHLTVVLSGDIFYAMVVEDADLALDRFQAFESEARMASMTLKDFLQKYYYRINHGTTIQEIQSNSVIYTIGRLSESGIAYYRMPVGGKLELLNP